MADAMIQFPSQLLPLGQSPIYSFSFDINWYMHAMKISAVIYIYLEQLFSILQLSSFFGKTTGFICFHTHS